MGLVVRWLRIKSGIAEAVRWFMLVVVFVAIQANATDRRAYQHGVDFVKLPDADYELFWSSSPGDPPQGIVKATLPDNIECEYFVHDIYASQVDARRPEIEPSPVIALKEAQEPVSAAVSGNGRILLTFEDGSGADLERFCDGNVQQRYQLFDASLKPLTDIRTVSVMGGHSGHVASVGNYFVIAYAEGWIDGGGIDEAGTADDIHLDVLDGQGSFIRHRDVAVDSGAQRDWWPLIAGSNTNALVVWQRFVDGGKYASLMYSIYDPVTDRIVEAPTLLRTNVIYYHYDVQYLPNIRRFLITGNYLVHASLPVAAGTMAVTTPRLFTVLLDNTGRIVAQWDDESPCWSCGSYHYYNMVREAQPAMLEIDSQSASVVYPVKPRGVVVMKVTATGITTVDYHDANHYWFPLGADGIFLDPQTVYFVNLSPTGVKPITINLAE